MVKVEKMLKIKNLLEDQGVKVTTYNDSKNVYEKMTGWAEPKKIIELTLPKSGRKLRFYQWETLDEKTFNMLTNVGTVGEKAVLERIYPGVDVQNIDPPVYSSPVKYSDFLDMFQNEYEVIYKYVPYLCNDPMGTTMFCYGQIAIPRETPDKNLLDAITDDAIAEKKVQVKEMVSTGLLTIANIHTENVRKIEWRLHPSGKTDYIILNYPWFRYLHFMYDGYIIDDANKKILFMEDYILLESLTAGKITPQQAMKQMDPWDIISFQEFQNRFDFVP
jgi:hypothetical protein